MQNFKLHLIKHLTPSNQKAKHCKHCNQLIPVAIFSKHLREVHPTTVQFPCTNCMATFSRESNLKSHMEKHIPKSDWVWFCKLCCQSFASENKLKAHELTVHQNESGILCRHCDLGGFENRNDIKEHIQEAHKKIFACSVCKIREISLVAAREHFRSVHSERPFKCHKCGNIFGTMIEVHAHVSAAHAEMMEVNSKNHEECNCSLCGAVFKTGKNIFCKLDY